VQLPRPFSLYDRADDGSWGSFLIKPIGDGTRALCDVAPGEGIVLTGPLGQPFPMDVADPVLVAGGVGLAPFLLWAKHARAQGRLPRLVFGGRTREALAGIADFAGLARVHAATDDGSEGFRGNVLGLLERLQGEGEIPRDVRLLACGPHPMLVAVERLARAQELDCWLSLETLMGCGVGICNGCPVVTRREGPLGGWPNAKCCVEGPVFHAGAIELATHGAAHGSPSHGAPAVAEAAHKPVCGRSGN
jgi:dihydroorotate dehydrogenase electron transfer subunit